MNQRIPCFMADSDEARLLDTYDAMLGTRVENHTDYLLAECKSVEYAEQLNRDYDLYDGEFLSELMAEIAKWTGRSDDANDRMRKLHVLLANELRKVAESEVGDE